MPKTPARKKSKFDIASIAVLFLPVAFLLGIGAGYLLWGSSAASAGTFNPVDDDPALGPKNAPVTIVEFSDYQCPACRAWYDQIYRQLMTEYEGKIRFVYRDFPLTSIHPGAQPAAEAANCANDQDKYWEFHNALFSGQYNLDRNGFLQIASDLALDTNSFTACIDSGKYASEVLADLQDGINLGVDATPTFYINGFKVVGVPSYASFKNVVDQMLAGNK
jgi:protein-disulfide isomerase